MSKVFRRPMFRKGGNVGEGIMTGIVDREQYANGPNMFDIAGPRTMDSGAPKAINQSIDIPDLGTITERNVKALLEQAGPSEAYDPLTSFLLQYGPAAAKQTGGGTFANLIAAAEKPVASLIEAKAKESDFLRSLRTQAAGAAIKERSELESAERDRLFRKELADMQADLNRDLSQAEILAAKERADEAFRNQMTLQAERLAEERKTKMDILERGKELERMTTGEKIQQYTPQYAESEYDNDMTKGNRRAQYEFEIRDQIAKEYGENKVGGHVNIDMDNLKQQNTNAKPRVKKGGANKIYYNVNDGKTYILTEGGQWEPFSLGTPKTELDTTVTENADAAVAAEEQKKKEIGERFEYFSPSQKKTIEELKEKNLEVPFGGTGA
jgi:hypothetical protein